MPRFSIAPKIHFSSTRTREYKTPILSRRCIYGLRKGDSASRPYKYLFTPIFLFHGRQFNRGRVEPGHFQVHTAVRTYNDLTDFGALDYARARLDRLGVNKALRRAGVRDGDIVRIGDFEFEYEEDR